jgi:serralysin
MSLRHARLAITAAACALLLPLATPAAVAGQPDGYGPSAPFIDALMPEHGPVEPMKNQSKIIRTTYGYRLTSGQQHNRITITLTRTGLLRFRDTGTKSWKSLPRACKPRRVTTGIKAVCRVPARILNATPTLLEVHPRLGNDYVDGRTLPARFQMAVLADAGHDTVFTGAGNDFINGASGSDRIRGGAGDDWIRGGADNDRIWGGPGDDYIVGMGGNDTIYGGPGTNRIYDK